MEGLLWEQDAPSYTKKGRVMFDLPIKNSAKYPCRTTFCTSSEMDRTLNRLKNEHEVHIPELIRNAIEEYFINHKIKKLLTDTEKLSQKNLQN